MSKSHSNHSHDHSSVKNISVAFFLNLFFTIIEIIGGLLTNSLAILSDALHDLGDSLSLGMAWFFEKISRRSRSKRYSYGYKRFSLLAALINSMVLIIGSVIILSQAIPKLLAPGNPNPEGMLILAIFGVVFNGIAVFTLQKGTSLNEKVVRLHLLEDVIGWIAVLVVSAVMNFYYLPILDPLLSIAISLFIAYNAVKNLLASLKIMLQAVPEEIETGNLERQLLQIEGVKSLHDTHIWTLDGQYNILTIHLVIEKNLPTEEMLFIKQKAREIAQKHNIQHATLEIGLEGDQCELENC